MAKRQGSCSCDNRASISGEISWSECQRTIRTAAKSDIDALGAIEDAVFGRIAFPADRSAASLANTATLLVANLLLGS